MLKEIRWDYVVIEFFIVLLGILVAFQLQRWAENVKLGEKETYYINSLKNELNNEMMRVESMKVQYSMHYSRLQTAVDSIWNSNATLTDTHRIKITISEVPNLPLLTQSRTSYDDLINSGQLSIIQEPELRRLLSEHFSENERMWGSINRSIERYHDKLNDLLYSEYLDPREKIRFSEFADSETIDEPLDYQRMRNDEQLKQTVLEGMVYIVRYLEMMDRYKVSLEKMEITLGE